MIYPTPIVKDAADIVAGDVVFWPKSRNSDLWWRHVVFVSHHGTAPDRKARLHFSAHNSQEYPANDLVIVGFLEEDED